MAHSTLNAHTLDADAGRLLRYLQRGGNQSYYLTFDANGHAHATWYNSGGLPPWPPAGTNVYFGVNPCTAIPTTNAAGKPAKPENVRGRVENIAALNCLYAEFDAKDFGGMVHGVPLGALKHIHNLPTNFAPSVTVASGGGFHCYWLLAEPFVLDTPEKREQAVAIQRDWVTFVRGDKAAKDIARVLRVPGTLNYKYEPARPVAFVEQAYSRRYHIQILELELDDWRQTANAPAPRNARTPKPDAPACHTDGLQPSVDFLAISKAAAALARLRVERRDEYTSWLQVGMALRELGDDGLWLWQRWSEASPKYKVGECHDKWATFQPGAECNGYTLASLLAWARDDAGEPVSTLDEAERLQLQDLQARELQTTRILAMKAPMAAKAVIVAMLPRLDAKRALVADRAEHSGSLAVNYGTFADIMNTSKATVARAIDVGEQAGLWRKDAECKQTKSGYDVLAMRLDLQPAFYRPELAQPIELKPRGGKRANAGRKPKCATCPPGTPMRETTETTIKTFCHGCGECLDEVTTYSSRELMPDDAPAATEFKHETGNAPCYAPGDVWHACWHGPDADEPVTVVGLWDAAKSPDGRAYYQVRESATGMPVDEVELLTRQAEHADEFKHETGIPAANVETNAPEFKHATGKRHADAAGTTPVSCLKKTHAELVPVALTETFDMPTAIRLADTYAPDDAAERLAFKTGLTWLQRGEHEKAAAAAANVHDERACAMLLHLANRPPALAPGLRE